MSIVALTRELTSEVSHTSHFNPITCGAELFFEMFFAFATGIISSTVLPMSPWFLEQMTTLYPLFANNSAVAFHMPLVEPVIIAVGTVASSTFSIKGESSVSIYMC
jgi:hypothetical protein